MLQNTWGMLGPEHLSSSRRSRTLGLGAAVRQFNELAVPGLGGVWFGKQVMLAMLGLRVAELAREKGAKASNIEVANAIEALACLFEFKRNKWKRDGRLRGNTKLQGGDDDYRFSRLKQRNFYVTQPMRMTTVQALPSLGFVRSDSARFNAFRSTETGRDFIEQADIAVLDKLVKWIGGSIKVDSKSMIDALSPVQPLSTAAASMLVEALRHGQLGSAESRQRRSHALAWVERLRNQGNIAPSWATKPPEITDEHWRDLKAGAKLFTLRDAAINVLDDLEGDLGSRTKPAFRLGSELPGSVKSGLDTLRILASEYLKLGHPQPDADLFCKECQSEATRVLGRLVERDGRVLRMAGDEILPSMAYTGRPPAIISQDDDADQPDTATLSLPEGISYRVGNLYLLNLDLNGGLDTWLKRQQGAAKP